MFLGRDGKYYFDEKNEVVFGDECYKEIYSSAIENLLSSYRKEVPFLEKDAYMHPLIEKSVEFLRK